MQTKATGACWVGPTVVSVLLVPCPILYPHSWHEMLPVMGVARLYLLCPLCLCLAEVKGLMVCGTEMWRSGGIFTMPSCAVVRDAKPRGSVLCAGLRNIPLGL